MDDDKSWNPDDEKPRKKPKHRSPKTSKDKKGGKRQAKPRVEKVTNTKRSGKAIKTKAKSIPHESRDQIRGRERGNKRSKIGPTGSSARTLPPRAGTEYDDVSQDCDLLNSARDTEREPSIPSAERSVAKNKQCQCSTLHSEPSLPEEEMDRLAEQYVESIEPDLSTVVDTRDRDSSLPSICRICNNESTKRNHTSSAPRRHFGSSGHKSSSDDTHIVTEVPPGPLAELLPPGTRVRRPPGMLVQLLAQVIHESPCKALRLHHVYAALQNRYPYFKFMSKKEVMTWKSTIRHALYRKGFKKVVFSTGESSAKSQFRRVDYENRPRGWAMFEAPNFKQTKNGEPQAALQNSCRSPSSQLSAPSTATPFVRSQQPDVKFGLLSPISPPPPQQPQECQTLLFSQAAMQYQQQHKREELQKSPTNDPISTLPPPLTQQAWGAGSAIVKSTAWRQPSPPAGSDSLDEASKGRPSSKHSCCSQSMSSQPSLQSCLGSPGRQRSHMEQELSPQGHYGANTEQVAAPPHPSISLPMKQERDLWLLENAVSADEFNEAWSPWNPDELSRGPELQVSIDHPYAKKCPEAGGDFDTRQSLAPHRSLSSSRSTQDAPSSPFQGSFELPSPQQASQLVPGHELRLRPKSFLSPERFSQEQAPMMPPPPFPSRPSPRCSRESTPPKREPPQSPWQPFSPKEPTRPQGQDSPAQQDLVLKGRWVPGPPSQPWYDTRYEPRNLPIAASVFEPVYSAVANPVDVVRMRDGTMYILSWPSVIDLQSCAEHARCTWE